MGDEFKRKVLEADGSPRSLINIYINGKNAAFDNGLDTPLNENDEVYILPAVAGGSDLSEKELDRFSRQVMLEQIGYDGQLKLKNAKVCVVGDKLIELGNGTVGAPTGDAGIVIERGSGDNGFIGFDESEDKFALGSDRPS